MRNIKNAFIIGSGGQARVILSILKKDYKNIYIVKKIYKLEQKKYLNDQNLGIKLQYLSSIYDLKANNNNYYFIAIGDIKIRKNIFNKCLKRKLNLPNLISKKSIVDDSATIGMGNLVLPLSHIGPYAKIGNNNIINTNSNVEHEVILGDHNNLNPGAIICGRSKIDDNVQIGSNSVVIENIHVKNGSTIGAGSVLVKNTRFTNKTYIGLPAKVVKN